MTLTIEPSSLHGTVRAPASKSVMIRALAAALLSRGVTVLHHPGRCDDVLAAQQVIRSLGADVEEEADRWTIRGGIALREDVLDVGESGLAARLFTPLAALLSQPMTLTGGGSLMQRPMTMVEAPLRELGVTVSTTGGRLPLTVTGPLRGGKARVDGSKGSQFLTGLLMSLPLTEEESVLEVQELRSIPYIDLTVKVMRYFGVTVDHDEAYRTFRIPGGQQYQAVEMVSEGDWSGGAFLLVAAALAGDMTVTGLDPASVQADRRILEALQQAGVAVQTADDRLQIRQREIRPFTFDITHCPDLAPPLVCLAAAAGGDSVLHGTARLREKESDRAATLQDLAGRLGIRIDLQEDEMIIHGGNIQGGTVEAHSDHRIAMAAAVMALRAPQPVTIHGAECVNKSYPEFFEDLEKLGATVKNDD